jgi:hypothetical protein
MVQYTSGGASLLLPGATAPTRYAGGTTGGAPVSGTFAVGDFVVDELGLIWICTIAGSPGTWANAGANAGVSSFNSRAGVVLPGNADYLAVASGGLTGAVAASRFVGGTASGAPVAGTFAVGDFVVDQTGKMWVCTVAGTPGTWVQVGAASGVSSFNTRTGAVVPGNADYLAVASGGLTGAVAATRFVGGTASGAPVAGTFAVGDFIIDQTGDIWICTIAGTPGTWVDPVAEAVQSVAATDTSIVVGGTATAPTIATGTLDVIATQHPPAANWSNNSKKITSLANGSGAQDAAAYGQTPAGGATVSIAQGGTGQTTAGAAFNALNPNAAPVNFKPANPASTTSITLVMAGIGATCAYTPTGSGLVAVQLTGTFYQSVSVAPEVVIGGRYGTGTAPVNGAAVTGTRWGAGSDPAFTGPAAGSPSGFAFTDLLALAAGTAYWFDLAFDTGNAADAAHLQTLSVTIFELPLG